MNHRIIALSVVTTLWLGCEQKKVEPSRPEPSLPAEGSGQPPQRAELSSDLKTDNGASDGHVEFPQSRVRIRQPDGFERADSFEGFEHPGTQSSVMATSVPAPFAGMAAGFTQKHMTSRGWTLRSRADVRVDALPGILVHFDQPAAGQVFFKWVLVFGDERRTTMVTATSPKGEEQALSAKLKDVVLSTRLTPHAPSDPTGALPFRITASERLKLAPSMSNTLAYTRDGAIPTKSPDPLFMAAPSLGNVTVMDQQQFAERHLRQTAHTKEVIQKSAGPITIAGMIGYESLAEAKDLQSDQPVIIYQVILFEHASYIVMKGLVGAELGEQYLAEFKSMARSLERRPRQ